MVSRTYWHGPNRVHEDGIVLGDKPPLCSTTFKQSQSGEHITRTSSEDVKLKSFAKMDMPW